MTGWAEGLGPVEAGDRGRQALRPRRRRRRLRGLRLAHGDRARCRSRACRTARCVVLIEACEESGSYDLPAYVDHLRRAHRQAVAGGLPRLGLRQLRPAVVHHLAARPGRRQPHASRCSSEGVHSGDASRRRAVELPRPAPAAVAPRGRGHRPHPARGAARRDPGASAWQQAQASAAGAGRRRSTTSSRSLPGMTPMARRPRPSWCSTAPGGRRCRSPASTACPRCGNAGNVLRPHTAVKLSLRLPPTLDAQGAPASCCKQRC